MKKPKSSFCAVFAGRIFLFFIFVILSEGRRTPRTDSLARRTLFSEPTKPIPGPEKNYTGVRVKNDSLLLVYYHEQTVAVVEVNPSRILYNCELLEVRTKPDQQVALNILKPIASSQIKISFSDMLELMNECQKVDFLGDLVMKFISDNVRARFHNARELSSIFSGVVPGTKWCGHGDIAASYYDLGSERTVDKCCRTHDFCPVKVAGLKTQYNLTNYSIYSKSHCSCDEKFYRCLKNIGSTVSNLLGNIFFNVGNVQCVEDVIPEDPGSKPISKRFKTLGLKF